MRFLRPAIVMTLLFVVFTGFGFPALMFAIGRAFPHQADGSLIRNAKGDVIGSELIGQNFAKPMYFHPRPSAAGSGYDANNSGGTNLGPTSAKLIVGVHNKLPNGKDDPANQDGIVDRVKAYRAENGLAADAAVPADAVTSSGSGLDPHISPANAYIQAERVSKERHRPIEEIKRLVDENTDPRFVGIFGDPGVNVLKLNLALDR